MNLLITILTEHHQRVKEKALAHRCLIQAKALRTFHQLPVPWYHRLDKLPDGQQKNLLVKIRDARTLDELEEALADLYNIVRKPEKCRRLAWVHIAVMLCLKRFQHIPRIRDLCVGIVV